MQGRRSGLSSSKIDASAPLVITPHQRVSLAVIVVRDELHVVSLGRIMTTVLRYMLKLTHCFTVTGKTYAGPVSTSPGNPATPAPS